MDMGVLIILYIKIFLLFYNPLFCFSLSGISADHRHLRVSARKNPASTPPLLGLLRQSGPEDLWAYRERPSVIPGKDVQGSGETEETDRPGSTAGTLVCAVSPGPLSLVPVLPCPRPLTVRLSGPRCALRQSSLGSDTWSRRGVLISERWLMTDLFRPFSS